MATHAGYDGSEIVEKPVRKIPRYSYTNFPDIPANFRDKRLHFWFQKKYVANLFSTRLDRSAQT